MERSLPDGRALDVLQTLYGWLKAEPMIETVDRKDTRQRIAELLVAWDLPADDVFDEVVEFSCFCEKGKLLAAIGQERYGEYGLLRSLVVDETHRNRGLAKQLVTHLEDVARESGVRSMYLLTNTAETYFQSLDYAVVSREQVPLDIRNTKQFSTLCPGSATVMCKELVEL